MSISNNGADVESPAPLEFYAKRGTHAFVLVPLILYHLGAVVLFLYITFVWELWFGIVILLATNFALLPALAAMLWRRNESIHLSSSDLRLVRAKETLTIPMTDIQDISMAVYPFGPYYTFYSAILLTSGGRKVVFGSEFPDVQLIAGIIENLRLQRWLPHLRDQFNSGNPVNFTTIQIDQMGVQGEAKRKLAWSEIGQIALLPHPVVWIGGKWHRLAAKMPALPHGFIALARSALHQGDWEFDIHNSPHIKRFPIIGRKLGFHRKRSWWVRYRRSWTTRTHGLWLVLLGLVFFFVLLRIVLALTSAQMNASGVTTLTIVFLLIMLATFRVGDWWHNLRTPSTSFNSITRGTEGLVFTRGKQSFAYHWGNITAIASRALFTTRMGNRGNFPPLHFDHNLYLLVHTSDGRQFRIDHSLEHAEELFWQVVSNTYRLHLPHSRQQLAAGERLSFGRIEVDGQGLYANNKHLPWSEIRNSRTGRYTYRVYRFNELRPWCNIPLRQMKNNGVLDGLIGDKLDQTCRERGIPLLRHLPQVAMKNDDDVPLTLDWTQAPWVKETQPPPSHPLDTTPHP